MLREGTTIMKWYIDKDDELHCESCHIFLARIEVNRFTVTESNKLHRDHEPKCVGYEARLARMPLQ